MATASLVLCLIAAVEHVYFFLLEAVFWQKPLGLKTFSMDAQKAATTAELATNQGVYNLFLTAGLLWGAFAPEPFTFPVRAFFLGCVIVAALVGGATVSKRILLIQGTPAVLGMLALLAWHLG